MSKEEMKKLLKVYLKVHNKLNQENLGDFKVSMGKETKEQSFDLKRFFKETKRQMEDQSNDSSDRRIN
jgi:hypothetical protein